MRVELSRRQTLLGGLALGVVGAWPATADTPLAAEVRAFAGGAVPIPGRVRLDLPDVADNGEAVLLSVAIDSPMTAADHVTEVLILADANPRPTVVRLRLSPLSGRAAVTTRIRLADSQTVTALARMRDGSVHIDQRSVIVTLGGCAG
ncbi:thiosulfate oxidation carrier protein SoxY [Rhodobaculum claviforme]|uniref:Ig-like SoxY domain-containing protein n=1 Tax=Rhodobaculum claviforme TaxID=1549854 RepID=A0A934TNX4_9RHOB|nr:thiosulfate oxidation carrier protein SoxY [Rhodobaculum claviforme]MBK5928533.1 hypothetical protein [Rhodobaculum claviforme]